MRRRPRSTPTALLAAALLVPPPAAGALSFVDAAAAWGIDFRHRHGGRGEYHMVETAGSGVALFDADADGDLDLFFVDSGPLPPAAGLPGSRFLRNDPTADGPRFVDRTAASGLLPALYGMGAVAGDVDGDTDLDLFVTGYGPDALFLNRGDGTFEDRTANSGLADPRWTTGAAFADVDGDGRLDLYVAAYTEVDLAASPWCGDRARGIRSYCLPSSFAGLPGRFYRGRGDGSFEDRTRETGLGGVAGKGLGVVFGDFDGDRRVDLYVANDTDPNFYFRGRADGTFEEIGLAANVALSDAGHPEGGMGIAAGDADGDGLEDLFVTNFAFETNAYYVNAGDHLFLDRRYASGLAEPSLLLVGFGTAFADLDADADLDLVVANGHILDNFELLGDGETTYRQPNQVFENLGPGRFRLRRDAGVDLVRSSRGLAIGDLDGDLDLDLVVTNSNDLAEVYENRTAGGSSLRVDLRMPAGEGHGVGSRALLRSGGRTQVATVRTGGSYLSQSELTLCFGLGTAVDAVDLLLELRDGRRLRLAGLPTDRRIRVDVPARRGTTP